MKQDTLKLGLMGALLSLVLAGCTTPDTQDPTADSQVDVSTDSATSVGVGEGDGVSVGETGTTAIDADTVFYFDFDKAVLKPEARAALTMHAGSLRSSPRSIRLEGHADERGTREYNLALAERRANQVRDFLVLQGVNGADIEVISYGEEKPAAFGSDEDSLALNRRVELK